MSEKSSTAGPSEVDLDVVVIGGGPVGKMMALMMGRRGHRVLVIERKPAMYPLPRAVAHDAEIARIFQSVGMPVDSMPDAVEPYDDLYVWVNGDDEPLHLVDWRGIDPSGWNNTYFYNQPSVERHLAAHLESVPGVTFRQGVSAAVTDQNEDGVDVVLTLVGGNQERVRARYVIGADGANSSVSASLEVPWSDLGYFYDWLVIDVLPKPGLEVTKLAKQIADPARPTTVVPGGPGRRRWEFMRMEGESVEELTNPQKIWELLEPFGVTPETAEIERGVVYSFASGWAAAWKQGRVLLAGDAAHLMPPFAGQGLAAGLRDCLNLSWKLDLVLRGLAPASLLETYGQERIEHVSDFIDFSISLGKIICIRDAEDARRRDDAMKAELASGRMPEPPPAPRLGAGVHEGDSGGYLAWQGQIGVDGESERRRFDDVFGAGALIVSLSENLAGIGAELVDALGAAGIVVTSFDPTARPEELGVFSDVDGTYRDWFEMLGADAVLVRPDFYVYGSGSGAEATRELATSFLRRVGLTDAPRTGAASDPGSYPSTAGVRQERARGRAARLGESPM